VKSIRNTVLVLREVAQEEEDAEQTFCKYWFDVYTVLVFQDSTMPPTANVGKGKVLFSGWCKNFVNRAILKRDRAFIYSLSKGAKQAWPMLGELKKKAALEKHRKRFTECHGGLPADLAEMIKKVSKTVFSHHGEPKKFMPSASANLQASYKEGGATALFACCAKPTTPVWADEVLTANAQGPRQPFLLFSTTHQLSKNIATWRNEQHRNAYDHVIHGSAEHDFHFGGRRPVEGEEGFERIIPWADVDDHAWLLEKQSVYEEEKMGMGGCFEQVVGRRTGIIHCPMFDLEVVAIAEPGKYRIITKGNGYLYTALQPLQGLMLDQWKKDPAATMLHSDLTQKVQEIEDLCPDLPLWCSVDYEAATDLLKKSATLLAYTGVEHFPFADLGLLSFSPGLASWPEMVTYGKHEGKMFLGGGWGYHALHVDAQPMGHPLSFSLLCVINKSVLQCALDRWVILADTQAEILRRRDIARRMVKAVLVNGDDMLFKCEHSFYEVFMRTATDAGLKISIGKNYLSPDTCMINSQIFGVKANKVTRYGYLNQRLTSGNNIKDGVNTLATPTQVGRAVNDMIALVPWTQCVIPMVFRRWKEDSVKHGLHFTPNWYLPVHLGGYGIKREYAPKDLRITRDQRHVAAQFVLNPWLALYRQELSEKPGLPYRTPSLKFMNTVGEMEMLPGGVATVLSEQYGYDTDRDEWVGRLAYINRAMHLHQVTVESDAAMIARVLPPKKRWFKPLSLSGLEKYWSVRFIPKSRYPCPSLPVIPTRVLPADVFNPAVNPNARVHEEYYVSVATLNLFDAFERRRVPCPGGVWPVVSLPDNQAYTE